MRNVLVWTMGLTAIAGMAEAGLPTLNATCPTGIEVHADEGGPVYINGDEAKLSGSGDFFEARAGGITIDIGVNPDKTVSVSYTAPHGANGICKVAN